MPDCDEAPWPLKCQGFYTGDYVRAFLFSYYTTTTGGGRLNYRNILACPHFSALPAGTLTCRLDVAQTCEVIRVISGLYWGYISVIFALYSGCMGDNGK